MSTFTLAISCLTTSNLPWSMDLTFQVPMQYCSLQHWTLLPSPVTPTTGYWFCFRSIPSFFLELYLQWSPVAYWASTNLGSPSLHVLSNPDQTFVINLLNYLFCENLKISAASCQTHIFPACLLAKLLLLFYSVKQPVNHKIQNHKQPYKLLHVIPNIPLYQNIGQNFMKTYFWIQIENEKKV